MPATNFIIIDPCESTARYDYSPYPTYIGVENSLSARGTGSISGTRAEGAVNRYLGAGYTELYAGFWYRIDDADYDNTYFSFFGSTPIGTTQMSANIRKTSRHATFANFCGNFESNLIPRHTFRVGQFNWVEMHMSIAATGAFDVKINGDLVFSETGDTTSGGTITGIEWVQYLRSDDLISNNQWIDTLFVATDDWVGEQMLHTDRPASDGNYSQFLTTQGSDHAALINQEPPSEEAVFSNSGDKIDSFNFPAVPYYVSGINRFYFEPYIHASGGTLPSGIKAMARKDSTDYFSDGASIPIVGWTLIDYQTNPETAGAWATGDVGDFQFGFQVKE